MSVCEKKPAITKYTHNVYSQVMYGFDATSRA
jgi:hypothetical protein